LELSAGGCRGWLVGWLGGGILHTLANCQRVNLCGDCERWTEEMKESQWQAELESQSQSQPHWLNAFDSAQHATIIAAWPLMRLCGSFGDN